MFFFYFVISTFLWVSLKAAHNVAQDKEEQVLDKTETTAKIEFATPAEATAFNADLKKSLALQRNHEQKLATVR